MIQIQATRENESFPDYDDSRVLRAIANECERVPMHGGERLTQAAALHAVEMIARHWVATLDKTIGAHVTRGGHHVAVNFGTAPRQVRVLIVTVA